MAGASATTKYEVIRPFRRTDPRTLKDVNFQVGDSYAEAVEDYMLDQEGPDGRGPLIVDKVAAEKAAAAEAAAEKAAADKSDTPAPADSSSKEK